MAERRRGSGCLCYRKCLLLELLRGFFLSAGRGQVKLLLTNDDGPFCRGICALRGALEAFGSVSVICPAEERSGVSHGITFMVPLRVRRGHLADGTPAHLVSGTPADCVRFGFGHMCNPPPDLVVSGPNLGLNVGVDVFYSGTVAAALEGGLCGAAGVAVSTGRANSSRMERVADQAARVLKELLRHRALRPGRVFNVNIPELKDAAPPVRFTSQSLSVPPGAVLRAEAPDDRVRYWLDTTAGGPPHPEGSDAAAVEAGCISVTPLRLDLTDVEMLRELKRGSADG